MLFHHPAVPVLLPFGAVSNDIFIVSLEAPYANAIRDAKPYPEDPPIISTFFGPLNGGKFFASFI